MWEHLPRLTVDDARRWWRNRALQDSREYDLLDEPADDLVDVLAAHPFTATMLIEDLVAHAKPGDRLEWIGIHVVEELVAFRGPDCESIVRLAKINETAKAEIMATYRRPLPAWELPPASGV